MTISRNQWSNWLNLHRLSRQNGTYGRSFRVAMIVGTVLNLINQPDAMVSLVFLDFHSIQRTHVVKAVLTYIVPFLVATYGAMTALACNRNMTIRPYKKTAVNHLQLTITLKR